MRFVANLLLIIFFVALLLIALLAGALKFQVLDYHFWQTTFEKNNVYQNLSSTSKSSLESQIGKEGGNKNDAKVLTDLITAENVKDFVDKNIQHILDFANGKTPAVLVYLPIEKLPKGLLPRNLNGTQSVMPLKDLLTRLNYQNYSTLPLAGLSQSDQTAKLVFAGSLLLSAVVLILMILLVKPGGRFISPGIAFLSSGALTLLLAKIGESLRTFSLSSLPTSAPFTAILAGTLLPPVVQELTGTWSIIGVTLLVIGLGLFFVKKPGYNIRK